MEEQQIIENSEQVQSKERPRFARRLESSTWSIVLIIVGVYFLLREFNIINDQLINAALKSWPLLLVWLGVNSATKNNHKARSIGIVIIISLFVFILLQSIDFRLPLLR